MAENKLSGNFSPFNKYIANVIRSKLLLIADRECNCKDEMNNLRRNHFRINSKLPEELKVHTIFYIQFDNEVYNEATDLKQSVSTLPEMPYGKPPLISISNKTFSSSNKSTKSFKDSPKISDKSDEEANSSPMSKDRIRYPPTKLLRSPNVIKYNTPLEFKINNSQKQATKMKAMASFNYLRKKASDLTVFRKLTTKSSLKGSSQVKFDKNDQGSQVYRSCKKSETIKLSRAEINEKNLLIQFSLLKANIRDQCNTECKSAKNYERSPQRKFNTIKQEVMILKPDSPLKTISLSSPKKGCLKKSSNMTLKYKESIIEIDGE